MKYYAIQEKATGRLLAECDFGHADGKTRLRFASSKLPPLLLTEYSLHTELIRRRIDPVRYEVVVVEIKAVVRS